MTIIKVDGGWNFRPAVGKTFADKSTGQILGKHVFMWDAEYKVGDGDISFEEIPDPTYRSNRIFY